MFEDGSELKVIEQGAFIGCSALEQIVLPEGLEKIGLFAFYKTNLESIEFPVSLRTVSQGTFAKCKSLKRAKFCEGLEVLGTSEYANDGTWFYGVFQ